MIFLRVPRYRCNVVLTQNLIPAIMAHSPDTRTSIPLTCNNICCSSVIRSLVSSFDLKCLLLASMFFLFLQSVPMDKAGFRQRAVCMRNESSISTWYPCHPEPLNRSRNSQATSLLGHFQVRRSRYRSRIEGLYTLIEAL